jgi:hypothetical protein
MTATLNQKTTICKTISENPNIKKHWLADFEVCWEKLENISNGKIRYFYYLLNSRKYFEINKFLEDFKFQRLNIIN